MLFVSFTKGLEVSPMYSSSQPRSPHRYQWMVSLWLTIGSLSLGGDQKVFDGASTFEVSLDAIPTTDLFDTFTKTLCVAYDNMALTLNFFGGSRGTCDSLSIIPITCLTGRPIEPFLHLVQSPFGVFALCESFPEVLFFYFEQLRITAHSFGPMGEGVDDTKTWQRSCDGYPTVGTGLYEWVFCTQ